MPNPEARFVPPSEKERGPKQLRELFSNFRSSLDRAKQVDIGSARSQLTRDALEGAYDIKMGLLHRLESLVDAAGVMEMKYWDGGVDSHLSAIVELETALEKNTKGVSALDVARAKLEIEGQLRILATYINSFSRR